MQIIQYFQDICKSFCISKRRNYFFLRTILCVGVCACLCFFRMHNLLADIIWIWLSQFDEPSWNKSTRIHIHFHIKNISLPKAFLKNKSPLQRVKRFISLTEQLGPHISRSTRKSTIYIYIYIYILNQGSIPGWVISKTLKNGTWCHVNTQHYKVRIKGKVKQSREWNSTFP